ncbi:DNA-binding protein [Acidianus sulfidivorans JP7]|uniref:DNA-binding protein n=1 Tax=Acidianus sulfidivorans JP7 TaxID=619593 RepID=A0A2U9IKI3_9CREN|nr:NOB1 family endonuclease [Acidianus sulfidivorans]AWR96552.1 DNA-binding protein [Acidianus sulfidivorans JP7]
MAQIVFDTAGFLAGLENSFEKVYTTIEVINEVKDSESSKILDYAMSSGKIIVLSPSMSSLKKVKSILEDMNEKTLSKTDISVIALALDLSPSIVFTDDLSVQNVLFKLHIKYQSVKLNYNITRTKRIRYKCINCNRIFNNYISECPYCGGKIVKI